MPWPTFLLIGAQRSGTTSLYDYLGQHPEIYTCPSKEPHYFSAESFADGIGGPEGDGFWSSRITKEEDYLELFNGSENCRLAGEASTLYLYFNGTAQRIYACIPDVKLVVILRNPVERAFSEFMHNRKLGYEPLTDFGDAIDAEESRKKNGWGFPWDYTSKSSYFSQLKTYFDLFPRKNIHVIIFDDFSEDPIGETQKAYHFLGVNSAFVPNTAKVHHLSGSGRIPMLDFFLKSSIVRAFPRRLIPDGIKKYGYRLKQNNNQRPEMSAKIAVKLQRMFREDIENLAKLLERNLGIWLK